MPNDGAERGRAQPVPKAPSRPRSSQHSATGTVERWGRPGKRDCPPASWYPILPGCQRPPKVFKKSLGFSFTAWPVSGTAFLCQGPPGCSGPDAWKLVSCPRPTLSRPPVRRKESTRRARVRVLPCCARRGQHPPAPPQVPGDRAAGALLSLTGLRLPDPPDAVATGPRPGLLPPPGRGDPIRRAPRPELPPPPTWRARPAAEQPGGEQRTARPEAGAGPVETQRHFREALGHREDQALCYPRVGEAQPRAPERILKGRRQIRGAGQSLRGALQSQFWGYFKGIHGAHGSWSGLGVGRGPRRRGREGLGPGPGRRRPPEGRTAHPPGRLRGGGGATCMY